MAKEGNPWTIKKESQLRANDSESRIFSLQHQQNTLSGGFNPLIPIILTLQKSSKLK